MIGLTYCLFFLGKFNLLAELGIAVDHIPNLPMRIFHSNLLYNIEYENHLCQASAIILAPFNNIEGEKYIESLTVGKTLLYPINNSDKIGTHRPGIFYCDPAFDGTRTGAAAASRTLAWLGSAERRASTTAILDPSRCRACGTCVEICEICAPSLENDGLKRRSVIDRFICTGCGTCASHCPSGAIQIADSGLKQLEATLEILLG